MAKVQQASRSSPPSLPAEGAAAPVSAKFKFANIEKDTDIDLFLRSFEKACRQYRLSQDQWARHLTPLLRYKALDAFAELPAEKDNDYAAIKDAIITKYQLTPEAYRKKFRAWQKKSSDSYRDVVSSLLTTLRQWTLGLTKGSYDVLEDLIVLEQFLNICPADVRQFVLERKPASATVAADLAETFATTRVADTRRTVPSSWRGGQPNTSADPPAPVSRPPQRPPSAAAAPRPAAPGEVICHYCRQPGHMKFDCPERRQTPPAPGSSASPAPHPQQRHPASEPQPGSSDFVLFARGKEIRDRTDQQQLVRVNGKVVTGFRDTGADITLVHSHLVPKESISSSRSLALTGVEGTLFHIAHARVKLDWGVGGVQERVVGVMKDLPVPVLLGTDLGKLVSYYEPATTALSLTEGDGLSTHHQVLYTLGGAPGGGGLNVPSSRVPGSIVPASKAPEFDVQTVCCDDAVTVPEFTVQPVCNEKMSIPVNVITACNDDLSNVRLCHSDSVPVLAVPRSCTAQNPSSEQVEGVPASSPSSDRRDETFQPLASCDMSQLAETDSAVFSAALQSDPSLEVLRQQAAEPLADGAAFKVYWEGGRLYSESVQPPTGRSHANTKWLVVPSAFRGHVLKSAHGNPLTGHSGVRKTLAGIRNQFYWPRMNRDVANYCRACAVCQELGRSRDSRGVPLGPQPLSRGTLRGLAVDLTNPLPVVSSPGRHHVRLQWRKRPVQNGPCRVNPEGSRPRPVQGNRATGSNRFPRRTGNPRPVSQVGRHAAGSRPQNANGELDQISQVSGNDTHLADECLSAFSPGRAVTDGCGAAGASCNRP